VGGLEAAGEVLFNYRRLHEIRRGNEEGSEDSMALRFLDSTVCGRANGGTGHRRWPVALLFMRTGGGRRPLGLAGPEWAVTAR
jgi:hypothetical protein